MPYADYKTKVFARIFSKTPDQLGLRRLNGIRAVVCIGYGHDHRQKELPPVSAAIADEAKRMFLNGEASYIIITGRGSWHPTRPMAEMMRLRINGSVPEGQIFTEPFSFSTRKHALNILPILKSIKAKDVCLLTKALHARRAKAIFARALNPEGISVCVIPVHGKYDEKEDRFSNHLSYLAYDSAAFFLAWVMGWIYRIPTRNLRI
jgi:uncharacterized SAM-binding protein YcdF (DUF218 family)